MKNEMTTAAVMKMIIIRVRVVFTSVSFFRFPFRRFLAKALEVVPVMFELTTTVGGHRDRCLGNLSFETLRDCDQPPLLELGQVSCQISFAEARHALKNQKIR